MYAQIVSRKSSTVSFCAALLCTWESSLSFKKIAAYIWIILDQDGKKLLFFQIDAKIKSELHADALGFLQNYLQAAGVALS